MKITFITAGKPSADWATGAVGHYTRFLSKYTKPELLSVRTAPKNAGSPAKARADEAERILRVAGKTDGFRVACDTGGKRFDSEGFARVLRGGLDNRGGRLIVVIGGAWGLDPSVLRWADLTWSLGPLTLPHELALIVAMEQIARAFSINRGESYHK